MKRLSDSHRASLLYNFRHALKGGGRFFSESHMIDILAAQCFYEIRNLHEAGEATETIVDILDIYRQLAQDPATFDLSKLR